MNQPNPQYQQGQPAQREESQWAKAGREAREAAQAGIINGDHFLVAGIKASEDGLSKYPMNPLMDAYKTGLNAIAILDSIERNGYRSGLSLKHADVSRTVGDKWQQMRNEDGTPALNPLGQPHLQFYRNARNGPKEDEKAIDTQGKERPGLRDPNTGRLLLDAAGNRIPDASSKKEFMVRIKMFNADQLQIDLLEQSRFRSKVEINPIERNIAQHTVARLHKEASASKALPDLVRLTTLAAVCGVESKPVKMNEQERQALAAAFNHESERAFNERHRDVPNPPPYKSVFTVLSEAHNDILGANGVLSQVKQAAKERTEKLANTADERAKAKEISNDITLGKHKDTDPDITD